MTSFRLITVVGARPQFVKAAAVSRAIARFNRQADGVRIDEQIIHTGQHYDPNMSQVFFDELQIPPPARNLEVRSGTHAEQTAGILLGLERVLIDERPDCVLVYGDTNSTLAGALAAAKLHIPVAHVEAGLRSFNRRMPEELNRVVADALADVLFCPTAAAVRNLAAEGVTKGVHLVGDVMYDSVLFYASLAEQSDGVFERLGLKPKEFYLATIHRAENTDDAARLAGIFAALGQLAYPVVLPLHPRTRKTLGDELAKVGPAVKVIDPVSYLEMLALEKRARLVLTDSGGVQKEAYWFGVPCVTLRDETEWEELVHAGVNRLAGASTESILAAVEHFEATVQTVRAAGPLNLYGDGNSATQILSVLVERQ